MKKFPVVFEISGDECRAWCDAPRLPDGHGGFHAESTCFIAGARYHAAGIRSAYDHRFPAEFRVQCFFHRSEKSVKVHMENVPFFFLEMRKKLFGAECFGHIKRFMWRLSF